MSSIVLLLTGLAFAGAPIAIPLPSEAAPDAKELEAHLQAALGVDNLKLGKGDEIAHPKALLTDLMVRPGECIAAVGAKQLEELKVLGEKADDVYLVYTTNEKAKSAVVWRYGAKKDQVVRVAFDGAKILKPATAPAKLVLLTKEGERKIPDAVEEERAWLGAAAVDVVDTDGALMDALMAKPDECAPELGEGVPERLAALKGDVEGDLMIAIHHADGSKFWRFDAESGRLFKVEIK